MSRIGRLPIAVPGSVQVSVEDRTVTVKGPKGQLSLQVAEPISVSVSDGTIEVSRPDDERRSKQLHGLTRTLVNNMVIGVTQGYRKTLEVVGTGYRVTAKGAGLELALGYSHPVGVDAPEGISFQVETPTKFHINGIDKQGQGREVLRRGHPPQGRKGR
jgi:large subunit ribosomal protein L6